jgi:hypothetical protein
MYPELALAVGAIVAYAYFSREVNKITKLPQTVADSILPAVTNQLGKGFDSFLSKIPGSVATKPILGSVVTMSPAENVATMPLVGMQKAQTPWESMQLEKQIEAAANKARAEEDIKRLEIEAKIRNLEQERQESIQKAIIPISLASAQFGLPMSPFKF